MIKTAKRFSPIVLLLVGVCAVALVVVVDKTSVGPVFCSPQACAEARSYQTPSRSSNAGPALQYFVAVLKSLSVQADAAELLHDRMHFSFFRTLLERKDSGSTIRARVRNASFRGKRMASDDSIPIMSINFYAEGKRLVTKLISSIDVRVEKLILVISPTDPSTAAAVYEILKNRPEKLAFADEVHVVVCIGPVGVAERWNEAIWMFPDSPYWFIVSGDVEFLPGTLRESAHFMASVVRDREFSVRASLYTFSHGFPCFAVTNAGIQFAGSFDENVFPAYYEDTEYAMRLKALERKMLKSCPGFCFLRGMQTAKKELFDLLHNGTPLGSGKYTSGFDRMGGNYGITYTRKPLNQFQKGMLEEAKNHYFVLKKWGCVDLSKEKTRDKIACPHALFEAPYNVSGNSLTDWQLDVKRRLCVIHGPCA